MDNINPKRRASLRGKGREILLGEHNREEQSEIEALVEPAGRPVSSGQAVDPAALTLTPDERASLLDFDDIPAVGEISDLPLLGFGDPLEEEMQPEQAAFQSVNDDPAIDIPADTLPVGEGPADELVQPEIAPLPEATPLPERMPTAKPEKKMAVPPIGVPPVQSDLWPVNKKTASFGRVEEHEGGLVVPPGEVIEAAPPSEIADPFAPILRRQASEELFHSTAEPDKSLLDALVDDEHLKKLWDQIEAMHEDLVQNVQGDRGPTDVYQQELLRASSLLLESRSNYDDARAIVYRIRADLNRQRKVTADVMKYRPLLLNYYVGWGIAWVVLFALKELFAGVADAVGVPVVAAFYHPMLFGVLGALISGYLTLERHTTKLRDFDPIHISWYLFNPLLGGVMGLLMFLLYAVINDDVLQSTSTFRLEIAVAWLLCAVAGMNQNNVLRQMNDLFKRVGRGGKG